MVGKRTRDRGRGRWAGTVAAFPKCSANPAPPTLRLKRLARAENTVRGQRHQRTGGLLTPVTIRVNLLTKFAGEMRERVGGPPACRSARSRSPTAHTAPASRRRGARLLQGDGRAGDGDPPALARPASQLQASSSLGTLLNHCRAQAAAGKWCGNMRRGRNDATAGNTGDAGDETVARIAVATRASRRLAVLLRQGHVKFRVGEHLYGRVLAVLDEVPRAAGPSTPSRHA
jgi:hypothetical protein